VLQQQLVTEDERAVINRNVIEVGEKKREKYGGKDYSQTEYLQRWDTAGVSTYKHL